ncbi:MAG TPA: hypothetical protein VKT77_09840 [Chthonomonadaceae bacterium]|nr:hypothetical protein [Chthonomonadaceae bacterium]
MDEAIYREWWPLHVRHARGETLTAEEQAAYELGRDQLYTDENLAGSGDEEQRLRSRIADMERQLDQLLEEYRTLKARSEGLEARLSEPAKRAAGATG